VGCGNWIIAVELRVRGWAARGTVALSPTASAKPGGVEALPTRRHQETTWNTRSCPQMLCLGSRVEAAGRGDRSMQQRRPETSGVVAGNRGSGLAAGGAAQGRGCPPPATRRHLCPGPLRHGRGGPGLSRTRHPHRPALPERPAAVVHRVSVKGKLAALVPSGPLTVGWRCARGRRGPGRAGGWPARAVLDR
jgi:hypothetical protein